MTHGFLLRALATALLCLAGSAAMAAKPNPDEFCFKCHSAKGDKPLKNSAALVDPARFKASAHGASRTKCVECHEDAPADAEHAAKLKPVECTNCHEDAVKEFQATVHGKARAGGNKVAATCADCHGPAHDVIASAEPASKTNRANIEQTCDGCHGNDKLVQQAHLPGGNVGKLYHDSIHGRLLQQGRYNAQAPTCTGCHGTHSIKAKKDPESRTAHEKLTKMCGSCHQRELVAFSGGKHGELRHGGDKTAPDCVDCHSAHSIQNAARPEWKVKVIGECGNCHDDFATSYRLTYHGKVTNLGFADIATCAACHGSHDIRPASDPTSPIAPENRLATCQKCHKNASASFASWDPHPQPASKERDPVLYWASIGMNGLLAGVFIFFGLHTVLWAYRSFADAIKQRRGGSKH